jgi:hypothetical protein
VLSSVREGVTKALQSTLADREQIISKRQRTLDDREADLKKKTSEIQQEAERLAEQRLKEREVHIKSEAAKQAVKAITRGRRKKEKISLLRQAAFA